MRFQESDMETATSFWYVEGSPSEYGQGETCFPEANLGIAQINAYLGT